MGEDASYRVTKMPLTTLLQNHKEGRKQILGSAALKCGLDQRPVLGERERLRGLHGSVLNWPKDYLNFLSKSLQSSRFCGFSNKVINKVIND